MALAAAVPVHPELTALAVAYRNAKYIADEVLPRVRVGKEEFKYRKFAAGDLFTLPDTKIGRRSLPSVVELPGSEATDTTKDYGLDDLVPQSDIDNHKDTGYDPLAGATEYTTGLLYLDREKRVADKVFDAANYASANKVTLSGTDQWSDFTNSKPIEDILKGLDAGIMRPNIMVIGRAAYTKLIQHPKIVEAVKGTGADVGIVKRAQIAELFELEDVLVGEGWFNSAKKGQAASMSRVWGKHCALLYRERLTDTQRGMSFGFTAQFGSIIAWTEFEKTLGLKGNHRVRVGESVSETLMANDLGYFLKDVVA